MMCQILFDFIKFPKSYEQGFSSQLFEIATVTIFGWNTLEKQIFSEISQKNIARKRDTGYEPPQLFNSPKWFNFKKKDFKNISLRCCPSQHFFLVRNFAKMQTLKMLCYTLKGFFGKFF